MTDGLVLDMGTQLLRVLAVSGLFVTLALVHTGGLQGTGDTRSPFFISLVSQVAVPLGLCLVLQMAGALGAARHLDRHPRSATRPARVLSILRFRQGKWRTIHVGIAAAGAPLSMLSEGSASREQSARRPIPSLFDFEEDPPPATLRRVRRRPAAARPARRRARPAATTRCRCTTRRDRAT